MIGRIVLAVLMAGTAFAGQSLMLSPGVMGRFIVPDTTAFAALQDFRFELRIHGSFNANPANYSNVWESGLLNIRYGLQGATTLSVFDTSGISGANVWIPVNGRSDIVMRIQRFMSAGRFQVEIWDIDGNNYGIYTGATPTTPKSIVGARSIGGPQTDMNIAWAHWSSSTVPPGGSPPSGSDKGDLANWEFETNLLEPAGLAITSSGAGYKQTPVYAPVSSPIIPDTPSWMADPVVRAGFPARLDGSGSYSLIDSPALKHLWQQVDGPAKLQWSDHTAVRPEVRGLVFGEYTVRLTVTDDSGQVSFNDLTFGAVATDDKGVVVNSDPMVDAVFGPMIRFGVSPWPWQDQNHQDLARAYGALVTNGSDNWAADWALPLTGTVTFSKGSLYITGTGTSFQTDFCGGAGNTVPVGLYPAVVLSNGARKYAAIVSGCETQSRLRIVTGEDKYLPSLSHAVYSKTLNGAWWGGATNGSGGQNNANYYDNVLAQYALYYRSGLSRYLTYARTLADRWYDSPFFLRSGSPPRIWSLAGIMWRAWEGGKSTWWTDKLHPLLDSIRSQIAEGSIGDAREDAYKIAFTSIGALLTPDSSRSAVYAQALKDAAANVWQAQRAPEGNYLSNTNFYASWNGYSGTANVTHGSKVVTGTGTAWSGSWPWEGGNCFWLADDSRNGDPVTYTAAWNSATQITLDRPYEGPTATGRKWQLSNLCGMGTQPFMMGIVSDAWDYGYKLTGDSTMRDLVTGTAGWIFRKGIQASTNGLYYGREFPNCEPIADSIPNCSYNSVSAGSVEASRFLNGEVLGGLSVAYALNPDSASKLKIDKLFGATLGKLGGPESDGISASLLQSSLNGCCPKNFGFFHGFGRAYVWPAARLGGLSPKQDRTAWLDFRLADIPGAARARVTFLSPARSSQSKVCTSMPCGVPVDLRQSTESRIVLEYLSAGGKLLSVGEPTLVR